jgi:phage protein D
MKRKVVRKPKPARAKKARKLPSKSRAPVKATPADTAEAAVAASAQALGISLDTAWRDGVTFNLRLILRHAALVDEFPLPDDAEPAPVFHA